MLRRPINRCLISLSPSSESLSPSSDSFVNPRNAVTLPCTAAILFAILEFVIRFVSNFYNWCPVSLRTIQWKNEVSVLINDWVTANYSVSRPPFVCLLGICNHICVKLLQLMCTVITQNSVKNEIFILINGWVTAIIVFYSRHFVCHLEFVIGFVSIFYNWCPVSLRTIQWNKKGQHRSCHTAKCNMLNK